MITEMEFLHPDEIKNINCNVFSVVKYKNGITTFEGFIYRINGKLYFWNKKNINQLMKLTLVSNYNLISQISFRNKDVLLNKLYLLISRKYKYINKSNLLKNYLNLIPFQFLQNTF